MGENIHDRENADVVDLSQGHAWRDRRGARRRQGAVGFDRDPRAGRAWPQRRAPEEYFDVLTWWGHRAHGAVTDEVVERIAGRVWQGMGLITVASGHFSKIFKKLMGAPCALHWREAGEKERVWVVNRNHPIARGWARRHFRRRAERNVRADLAIPQTARVSVWYRGSEVFRSGVAFSSAAAAASSSIFRRATKSIRSTTTPTSRPFCATPSNGRPIRRAGTTLRRRQHAGRKRPRTDRAKGAAPAFARRGGLALRMPRP